MERYLFWEIVLNVYILTELSIIFSDMFVGSLRDIVIVIDLSQKELDNPLLLSKIVSLHYYMGM